MGEIFKKETPNSIMPFTGERFTDGHDIETEIEHYHRYFFARSYCRGKDVLDIASGEGYGSAILAQVAHSVVGVDICEEAVLHAQKAHVRSNLKYLTGDVRHIPLEDKSVDVVVSFETLEHFYEHDLFMQEVKRILRPGGFLIISTPNSDIYSAIGIPANPYHVNELTKDEFNILCKKYFKYISTVNQRTLMGSMLITENDTTGLPLLFESRDKDHVECSKGLSKSYYLISILSDENSLIAQNSIYIYQNIRDLLNSKIQYFQQIINEKSRHIENIETMLQEKIEHINNIENVLSIKIKHIENLETISVDKNKHIENLENILIEKNKHIDNLEKVLIEKNNQIDDLKSGASKQLKHIADIENLFIDKDRQIDNLENILFDKEQDLQLIICERNYFKNKFSRSLINKLRKKILDRKAIKIFNKSNFLDTKWYLDQYPDVKQMGMDPVTHFVKFGFSEFRNPGPHFSTKEYLIKNPNLQNLGITALLQFDNIRKKSALLSHIETIQK